MPEKLGLAQVKKGLRKSYGPNVVGCGKKIATKDKRVSSGSLALDMAFGGSVETDFGVIIGRIHSFWGDKSGGKTSTAHRIAGIFQGLCRNCWRPAKNVQAVPPTDAELKEDPEARWSATGECDCYAKGLMDLDLVIPKREDKEKAKDYAERVGKFKEDFKKNSYEETVVAFVDTEDAFEQIYFDNFGDSRRLMLVRPAVGEDAVDLAHVLASSGCVDLLILDSIAHFAPKDEIEKSAHEWQQGLQARIVNKCVRKLVVAAQGNHHENSRRLTQIWINQKRDDIGVVFGDPSKKPGGQGQEFAAHVEIRFRNSKLEHITDNYGGKKDIISTLVSEKFNFEVTKNKLASTKGRKGSYEQSPTGEVLEDEFIFKVAMKFLLKEETKPKGYSWAGIHFKTQKEFMEKIKSDPEIGDAIRKAILVRFMPPKKR